MRRPMTAVLLLLYVLVGACSRKPRPAAPAPSDASTPTSVTPTAREEPSRPTVDAEEARRREEVARARATLEQMVFFDYDRSTIRSDGRPVLDAKLPILRANPDVRIRIEGHADERGSVEYNLALSLRRAQSVRAYLEDFGISRDRVEIAGLGEERRLDFGTSETAYARNRRSEFRIIAGLASNNNE